VESAIREIVKTVWKTVLGLPVACSDKAARKEPVHALAACVQFSGAWQGTIILACSPALARIAAGRMFDTVPADVTMDQAQDVLCELINITGGNLKVLMPSRSFLSLPTVVEGFDYRLRVPGSHVEAEVNFESQGHWFTVTLLDRDEMESPEPLTLDCSPGDDMP
jgi:CheY-specific phosphatase CheX